MIIAVLFNSNDPSLGGYYGLPIAERILSSGILQNEKRHMKIGLGDILFFGMYSNISELRHLEQITLFHYDTEHLLIKKIDDCIATTTIFAWVIQNATTKTVEALHKNLLRFPPYLGIHTVNFSYTPHLMFYRNYIIDKYRIIGDTIKTFYSMGETDTIDTGEAEWLEQLGFRSIDFEDSGARHTIFDDFDTPEHFQRVDSFIQQVSSSFPNGEEDAFELAMLLNDIDPHLFNVLGAAVNTIKSIQTEEESAQVALSGRRYMEQLANVLFKPSEQKHKGRSVRQADYKNRLWAFIDDSIEENEEGQKKLLLLGKEVDRLVDTFNSGIHSSLDSKHITQAFADVAQLTLSLITLQPIYNKDPYYAYKDKLIEFAKKL